MQRKIFCLRTGQSVGLQIVDSLIRGDLQGLFTLSNGGKRTVAEVVFAK